MTSDQSAVGRDQILAMLSDLTVNQFDRAVELLPKQATFREAFSTIPKDVLSDMRAAKIEARKQAALRSLPQTKDGPPLISSMTLA